MAMRAALTRSSGALRASAARSVWAASQTQGVREFADTSFSYTPPGRNHLFVPGPTNITDRVQRAMMRSSENHRDPYFANFITPIFDDLRYLFQSVKGQVYIFCSTGTGAWESALTNTLSPGDKVIAFRYGQFSHLWIDQAQRLGLDVEVIECPWGEGADEGKLLEALKKDTDKKVKGVLVVHNETTTGVTSDIPAVRKAMDDSGTDALLFVDGVSSIGAMPFKMDEWRVDVAITGSQKALGLPTGLGLTCVSPKAHALGKTAQLRRVFFSYDDHDKTNATGNFPYTPSIPLLYGLRESIAQMREEGMENVWARHQRMGDATRAAMRALGLPLLCKQDRWNSNALTVVAVPDGIDSNDIVKTAYCKYNLTIGVGLSEVAGKVFRIGHLGDLNECSLLGAIAGVEMTLNDCGVKVPLGAGVAAAAAHLRETSAVIRTREIVPAHVHNANVVR